MKLHDGRRLVTWLCPGCERLHSATVGGGERPTWQNSGTDDAPSLAPSILYDGLHAGERRCHMYLDGGRSRFLDDCKHPLAGKTVDIPEHP